jgi:hypothetical protein
VIREPARHAARRLDDVDVGVALVLAREGDETAVGREVGGRLGAGAGRQASRVAALAPDEPDVAGEDEGHGVAADRRGAKDERGLGLRRERRAEAEQEGERDE